MKIGVVGAGAIGLTFAAALSHAHDVVVLARRWEVAELLSRDGITLVRESGTENVRVRVTTDPQACADRDSLLIAVKAYATADALTPLRGVLPLHALIASLQNGIDSADVARATLPGMRVLAGSTMQGAIALGNGRVRPMGRGETTFARDDTASPTSADLASAFSAAALGARIVDDIAPVLWRKLVLNAAINPLGALANRTNGGVVSDPDLSELARALAVEAATVARAEGVDPGDSWDAVVAAARASAANRNSMLQDLEAGRRTEIDAISGAIVRRARKHGIDVPLTETMLRLVRARERA